MMIALRGLLSIAIRLIKINTKLDKMADFLTKM